MEIPEFVDLYSNKTVRCAVVSPGIKILTNCSKTVLSVSNHWRVVVSNCAQYRKFSFCLVYSFFTIMDTSNYAAPNTPIASSKRPRIASKSIKSPSLQQARLNANTPERQENKKDYVRKVHHQKRDENATTIPCTPSKNLFSPGLRTDLHTSIKKDEEDNASHYDALISTASSDDEGDYRLPKVEEEQEQEEDKSKGEEEDEDVFNPYYFIAGLPHHSTVKVKDKVCLSADTFSSAATGLTSKTTLVLDLDETLVHCTVEPIEKPDLVFPVAFNGNVYQVYVRKRPYLDYFLETVSKSFEVVVFTASQKVYADVLLDQIDPERKFIDHRLFREACLLVQGNYLKDLHVIERDIRKTVLVDNSPHAYGYQIDNGIPIESWYDDEGDTELLKLIGFLRRVNGVEDVRPVVREHFKTYQLVEKARSGHPISLSAPPF